MKSRMTRRVVSVTPYCFVTLYPSRASNRRFFSGLCSRSHSTHSHSPSEFSCASLSQTMLPHVQQPDGAFFAHVPSALGAGVAAPALVPVQMVADMAVRAIP